MPQTRIPGSSPSRRGRDVPLLSRVAGLSAQAVERFASDLCAAHLQPVRELGAELARARAELADAIYGVVTSSSPELRRFLLAVKRDCFNGRSLRRRSTSPMWPALRERVGLPADRAVELEDALKRARDGFQKAYQRARESEVGALGELCRRPGLARGLALASPELMDNLHRLGRGDDAKKEAHLEASLLRYLSRAALKTSPFSTLTRLGFATGVAGLDGGAVRVVASNWSEHSLVRFKRYIPEQDYAALARHPGIRDRLRVALNSSIWERGPQQYCFLRPGAWRVQDGRMRYSMPSLVQLELDGPLVAWLRRELPARTRTLAELVRELAQALDADTATIRAMLSKLLDVGFVRLLPPWSSNEGHLERAMLDYLRSLPAGEELAAAIGHLDQLVALERGYAQAPEPMASLRGLERCVDDLWQSTRALGGIAPDVKRYRFAAGGLYEDVFVTASPDSEWREVVHVSRGAIDEVVRCGEPLAQLARLYHPQHEFLHAVTAFAAERWPGRRQVGALELVREVQPLWRSYSDYLRQWRRAPAPERREMVFDPFGLDALARLRSMRQEVWSRIEAQVEHGDEESCLDPDGVTSALASVPPRYRSPSHPAPFDACFLVQPADTRGHRWVVNHIFEGTGRYSSRYTPVMPDDLRERYTTHLAERATRDHHGDRAQLLDLMFSSGDTLNIHPAQTPKVLELPDEWLDLPPERKLGLDDLAIRFDQDGPRVVDGAGQPYAPVHLGVADASFMPMVIRLLAMFGPGELTGVTLPRRAHTRGDDVRVWPRLRVGNLFVRRRRWTIPASALPGGLTRAPAHEAFARIDEWRSSLEIPDRVFVRERLHDSRVRGDFYKPQYIDFTSPGLVALLVRILAKADDAVDMEEALPAPDSAPVDPDGRRWVLELQIETMAMRATGTPEPGRL